jgi:hypothetical protein
MHRHTKLSFDHDLLHILVATWIAILRSSKGLRWGTQQLLATRTDGRASVSSKGQLIVSLWWENDRGDGTCRERPMRRTGRQTTPNPKRQRPGNDFTAQLRTAERYSDRNAAYSQRGPRDRAAVSSRRIGRKKQSSIPNQGRQISRDEDGSMGS